MIHNFSVVSVTRRMPGIPWDLNRDGGKLLREPLALIKLIA